MGSIRIVGGGHYLKCACLQGRSRIICLIIIIIITQLDRVENVYGQSEEEKLVLLMPTPEKYTQPYITRFQEWYYSQTGKQISVIQNRVGGVNCLPYIKGQEGYPEEDVIASLGFDEFESLKNDGLLTQYKSPNAQSIPNLIDSLTLLDPDGYYTGFSLAAYGIMINTNTLQEYNLSKPLGYKDIATNPSYRDKIIMGSPLISSIAHGNIELILASYGWIEGWNISIHLASLHDKIEGSTGTATRAVANGEYAAVLTKNSYWNEYYTAGYPVEWIWPEEGTTFYALYVGILKGAKNIENAQLWIDWMLSREGQEAWMELRFETVLRSDIDTPEGIPNIQDLDIPSKINPYYDPLVVKGQYEEVSKIWMEKITGYHSVIRSSYDDNTELNNLLDSWIIKPLQESDDAITQAKNTILLTEQIELTEAGSVLLQQANEKLLQAETYNNIQYDHKMAKDHALEATSLAQLAGIYVPPPSVIPYYIAIVIVTAIGIIVSGRYATRYYDTRAQLHAKEEYEKVLRASEERFRSLFENSLQGIVITTISGDISSLNQAAATIFGYENIDEVTGKNVYEVFIDDNEREKLLEILQEEGFISDYEINIRRRDGAIRKLSAYAVGIRDSDGNIIRLEVYFQDVTEEKQLAKELRIYTENLEILAEERAQEYRSLSDNLHVHATSLSEAETVLDISQISLKAIEQIFESTRVGFGVIENDSVVFLRANGTKSIPLPLNGPGISVRAVKTGKTQLVTDTLLDPSYVNIDLTRAVSRSELTVPLLVNDNVMGIIDIESEKVDAFNEQHVKLAEIYASHIVSHIIRLQQLNLLQEQNTKLLELDELKGRFIVTATHELRTPVTSILGYVDFMMGDESLNLSDEAKNDLKVVLRNSMRLAALTNDLLDVQRIQTGRLEIHPKEFDLVELVNQVVEELTPLLQEKNHVLSLDIPENLMILGDEIRISQLLINLIRNSNKFTPEEGEISVSIETLGDRVQVRIKDSGIGMTPSDMDKLFKPFPGINHGLNVSSTGLGLSISKGIVDLHEGKIWAESDGKGKGSMFIVELPL